MTIIEHIILFSILLIFYIFWGKKNANRNGAAFWKAAIIPILLYVFVTGSRYGWGNDYLWYRAQYEFAIYDPYQVAFNWLNQFLTLIGFNYVGAFMVYGFMFITCAFVFIRSFGSESKYMYCFLIPAALFISTNTIRQGVGTSFMLLALVFFQNKKWIYMGIAAIIAYSFHSATFITLGVLLGIFFMLKKPIHYAFSIPIYLFLTFIYDISSTSILASLVDGFSSFGGGKFQSYLSSGEKWFGEDAIKDHYGQGALALITSSLCYVSILYLGYQALKIRNNKMIVYLFNAVVTGFVLYRAVYAFELLNRMTLTLQMFYFVPLGYIFYVYFMDCKQPVTREAIRFRKQFHVGVTFILTYLFMYWGRFIFLYEKADFFWYHLDEYFDINQFMDQMYYL